MRPAVFEFCSLECKENVSDHLEPEYILMSII